MAKAYQKLKTKLAEYQKLAASAARHRKQKQKTASSDVGS